jgi:tripartite-type tricarboxylate transporter receptor subunit TctC
VVLKIFGILAVAWLASTLTAHADTDFPSRPVTIVVPFSAGGPSDVVTRILADELKKVWNQQVLVENKAGGATVIGNSYVAHSKPDGYTWLLATGSLVILPGVKSNLPYDTEKDFKAVSVIVDIPLAIVAHPGFAPNNFPELIEAAKKRESNPLTYATAGVASFSHMAGELLQKKAGIKLVHVPFNGASQAMPDTLSGRVDFQIGTWADQRPFVESGKLKLIAILHRTRVPEAPNTATVAETLKGLATPGGAFLAISVPAGVPDDVMKKIAEGMKTATTTKSYQDRILKLGSYPRYTTPAEADAFLANELKTWSELAHSAGIKVN